MAGVVSDCKALQPIEQGLAELLHGPKILLPVLGLRILREAFNAAGVSAIIEVGERRHNLNHATKHEMLTSITAHWEEPQVPERSLTVSFHVKKDCT
jgi:hypothetical protein